MAEFDDALGDLNGKLAAISTVLDAHPNIAAEVRRALENATAIAVAESQAQDDARANALARVTEQHLEKIAPTKRAPVADDPATKDKTA